MCSSLTVITFRDVGYCDRDRDRDRQLLTEKCFEPCQETSYDPNEYAVQSSNYIRETCKSCVIPCSYSSHETQTQSTRLVSCTESNDIICSDVEVTVAPREKIEMVNRNGQTMFSTNRLTSVDEVYDSLSQPTQERLSSTNVKSRGSQFLSMDSDSENDTLMKHRLPTPGK